MPGLHPASGSLFLWMTCFPRVRGCWSRHSDPAMMALDRALIFQRNTHTHPENFKFTIITELLFFSEIMLYLS